MRRYDVKAIMEGIKICPLLAINVIVNDDGEVNIGTPPVYCLEEDCAWFDENKRKCAVAVPRK